MNIMFDSMSTQVQVHNETQNRLVTLFGALENSGYNIAFTDFTQPITPQLGTPQNGGTDVLVILTHFPETQPGYTPAIPAGTNFNFFASDLSATTGIPNWVSNQGGNLLFVSNHTVFTTFDSALATALGITIVPAGFEIPQTANTPLVPAVMTANSVTGPDWLLNNVEAYVSCGVAPGNGTILYSFPPNVIDATGTYNPADYAFAVQFAYSNCNNDNTGSVIMAARSGLAGDAGTGWPAPGEVGNGSNLSFLLNCINVLGGGIS